jgi:thioredoxin 1
MRKPEIQIMNTKPITLDDKNFDAMVHGTDKPILIDFYADWCGPCQTIAPVIDELAHEFEGRAVVAKLNVDDAPLVASKFGVRSIPTLLIVQGGEIVGQIIGLTTKRMLAGKLEALLTDSAVAR